MQGDSDVLGEKRGKLSIISLLGAALTPGLSSWSFHSGVSTKPRHLSPILSFITQSGSLVGLATELCPNPALLFWEMPGDPFESWGLPGLLRGHQRGLVTRPLSHTDLGRANGNAGSPCHPTGHTGQGKASHTHLHELPFWLGLLGLQVPDQLVKMRNVSGHLGAVFLPDLANGLAQIL